ncbi:hypothetical protein [Georgenia sp. SYP-B2076]|uniref:hypothetical protein n=1 Tax=Georgenia sp. SYP-B2076 TaxID=2495881 RepID=UPI000F8EA519|nr:hypothetical protein [Georgenia sp. SYP-B2076]
MSTPPDWSPYGPGQQQDPHVPAPSPSTEYYGTTYPPAAPTVDPQAGRPSAPWEASALPTGGAGKKGMSGGKVALIASATGVVGLALGLAIGSAGGEPAPSAAPSSSAAAPESDAPEEPPATADSAVAPAPAPADGDEGTRANPFVIGDVVSSEDWEVVLGQPREALAEIQAENRFNDPPADGMAFWIVPVSATYTGAESGTAWLDLRVAFVGSDSRTYSDSCGVIPGSLTDVDELYTGGVAEGNVCVAVPSGADGLWTLSAGWGDPVFFTAAP